MEKMGRRSHSDRNLLKHKKQREKELSSGALEHTVVDKAEGSLTKIADRAPITSNQEPVLESILASSTSKPTSHQGGACPYSKPVEAFTPEQEITRAMLKKEQRECISYIKCKYSRRNVAAITPDDLTAVDPLLNVIHILHHNCVPVPAHWRLRNGKFLSEHVPKYTVASKHQNVYKIPLFAAKLYDPKDVYARSQRPNKDSKQCHSLHTVEIDYEYRKNWVTTPLLSHGDLYQETRSSIICRSAYSPGIMSDELREALNIQPNDPPPWLARQSLLPKPSWLQDISITALNISTPKQGTLFLRF